MADNPKDPKDEEAEPSIDQFDDLRENEGDLTPKVRFKRISNIALLMAYDMIDKLRYWEKESLRLPEDEIAKRTKQLAESVEQLREAYLAFSDLEL